MFRFWLDINKENELQLAEYAESLKEKRKFATVIRDALRLIKDLRQGRVEVLLALFPWIADHFAPAPATTAIVPSDDPIRQQLTTLTEMLLAQGAQPFAEGLPPSTIARLPAPPSVTADDVDDFELEISEASHDDDNRSDWNFMLASAMQVQGHCAGLPPEIIAYGLRTGRIKERDAPSSKNGGGPKAMDVPQFDAPAFDDLDVGFDTS